MTKTRTMTPMPTEIVTAAELAEACNCSERTIREHVPRGHVYRLGKGYDFRKSVLGMVDYHHVQGAKKGLGFAGLEPLWQSFAFILSRRREYLFRCEHVGAVLPTVLAMDDLPEAARAALSDLLAYVTAVDADPDDEDDEG